MAHPPSGYKALMATIERLTAKDVAVDGESFQKDLKELLPAQFKTYSASMFSQIKTLNKELEEKKMLLNVVKQGPFGYMPPPPSRHH